MCDYSLENIASRPAVVGEKLVVTQFVNSLTRGLAAVGHPGVVVCLLPGTELIFDQPLACDHPLGLYDKRQFHETAAVFRQINVLSPFEHHDALELPKGKFVLLTRLCVGQTVTVLQLPVTEKAEDVKAEEITAQPVLEPAL
jgi:hypothetical protein